MIDTKIERRMDLFEDGESSAKRQKYTENAETDGEVQFVTLAPPLRCPENRTESLIVGAEATTLAPSIMEVFFADVLFRIKTDQLLMTPKVTVDSALVREGLQSSTDINFTSDNVIIVNMFVDGILIARGKGENPDDAEKDAYEDFVTRYFIDPCEHR